MEFFNDLFRSYRESKGYSQEDIAKKLGITQQAVERWENGKNNPKAETVYKLAKILGMSVIDISDLPPEPETLKRLEEIEKSGFTCAITGRHQCPYDDAPPSKKYLLDIINKLNDHQTETLIAQALKIKNNTADIDSGNSSGGSGKSSDTTKAV